MSDSGERGLSYDGIAPHYDASRRIPWEVTEDIRNAAGTLLGVGRRCLVFEPGAGTGVFLLPWYQAGHPVFGIDISELMLTQAREKMPKGRFEIGDAANPPADATGAGVVLVSGLLHVVPDWRQVIEASYALLAPGGILTCIFGRQETPFPQPLFDQFGETYLQELATAGVAAQDPSASEPDIRQYLLALAEREGIRGTDQTQAILTRRWSRELTFAETIDTLRKRVHSWQQRIPEATHDTILDAALNREAPDPSSWPSIRETRIHRLSVAYLRRPMGTVPA